MQFVVYDQLQRKVSLSREPQQIISTVPSQTELLFYLGLNDQIVGITRFCTHPVDLTKSKKKIGGTKQLDLDLIKQLNPDLVIANKEENDQQQITALIDAGIPVYVSDPDDLESALAMIRAVGLLVNKAQEAHNLAAEIEMAFAGIKKRKPALRVAYMIWRKPYMAAGQHTFIDDMLQRCGLINVFEQQRYPEILPGSLAKANPDLVLLSSEPYPFKEKHMDEFKAISPGSKIKLVDGEMFSWYGSRLLQSAEYFIKLIADLQVDTSV